MSAARRRDRSARRSAPRPTRSPPPGSIRPRLDAELLLAEATGLEPRAARRVAGGAVSTAPAARAFGAMVRRRVRREPVAYILGRKRLSADRARGRPPRADPAAGDRAAGRARARARAGDACSTSAPARARSRWRSPTSCRRRDGGRHRHLARRARGRQGERASASGSGSGSLRARDRCPRAAASTSCWPTCPTCAEAEWAALAPEITEYEPIEALVAGPDRARGDRCAARRDGAARSPRRDRRSRWARARRRRWPSWCARAGFERVEIGATSPGSSAWSVAG